MNTTKGRGYTAVMAAAGLLLLWTGAGIDDARARGPFDETREMIVTAKDLDLSRPDNIRILYKRIWAAATHVCKPYNGDQAGSKVKLERVNCPPPVATGTSTTFICRVPWFR